MAGDSADRLRGSSVAVAGKGVLITGPSGAGKSSLALDLMALGGVLISDDWTLATLQESALIMDAPASIKGRIEARGIGILAAETAGPTPLELVVDLTESPDRRLPPSRYIEITGVFLPLVNAAYRPHLAAALRQLLLAGRVD